MNSKKLIALSCGVFALIGCGSTLAVNTSQSYHHPVITVGVFLQRQDTDGDPLEVAKASISHIRHCTGHGLNTTCLATLDGYNKPVFIAGVDFGKN